MAEHRTLTGAQNHEPKGVENATSGQVYIADGLGSGVWQNPLSDIKNLNIFTVEARIDDVSTVDSKAFFPINRPCTMDTIHLVTSDELTAANATVSLYRNGVLLGQNILIPFAGSTSGKILTKSFDPAYEFAAEDVLELRTDGASTGTVFLDISVILQAI